MVKIFFTIIVGWFLAQTILNFHIVLALFLLLGILLFCLTILVPTAHKILFYLMLFTLFFVPYQFFDFLNPFRVLNLMTISGILLSCYLFVNKNRKKHFNTKLLSFVYMIFVIVGAAGAFLTKSKLGAFKWLFYSIFTGFSVYNFIATLTRDEVKRIIQVFVYLGGIVAFYGFFEFFKRYSFILHRSTDRLTSTLGHPLVNALIFGILLFWSLFLYQDTKKKFYLFFTAIFLIAIILTQARGAWFSLIIVYVLTLFKYKAKLKHVFFAFLLTSIILIPSLNSIVVKRLSKSESAKHSSWSIRKESFSIGIQMIKKYSVTGTGLFNSKHFKTGFTPDTRLGKTTFENSLLEIFVETGIPGGVSFLMLLVMAGFIMFKYLKDHYVLLGFSFLFLVVDSLTFNILNVDRNSHFILWTVIAVSFSFCFRTQQE